MRAAPGSRQAEDKTTARQDKSIAAGTGLATSPGKPMAMDIRRPRASVLEPLECSLFIIEVKVPHFGFYKVTNESL